MNREYLFAVFFFVVLAALFWQLYQVFAIFIGPFLWAAVFALAVYPAYLLLLERVRRPAVASLILTIAIVFLVAAPVATLGTAAVRQGRTFYGQISEKIASGEARAWIESWRENRLVKIVSRAVPAQVRESVDPSELGVQGVQYGSQLLLAQMGDIAQGLVRLLVDFTLMLVILFFFLRDGRRLYLGLRDLLPMEKEHQDAVFGQLYETLSAVVQGMTVTAAVQGFLAGIGFWVLGVPIALFLGVASAIASFVPLGGAAMIWIPTAGWLFYEGLWIRGLVLVAWGSLVVSTVDNFLRALIIGNRTKIPTLFLFFGILGGIQAYGLIGAFLGPVLLATVVAFLKIYRSEYAGEGAREEVEVSHVPHLDEEEREVDPRGEPPADDVVGK